MKHLPEEWLSRVASDHLTLDAELRRLIRAARRTDGWRRANEGAVETTRAARSGGPRVTLTVAEARTLLRGSMPILPQRRRARERHARLFAALGIFQHRLPGLALDPVDQHVLAAARQLAAALDAWIGELAWRRAASTAGISWPVPLAVSGVMQPSTTQDVPDLFAQAADSTRFPTRRDEPAPTAPAAAAAPAARTAQAAA